MQNKKSLIVVILVLVAVLAAAGIAYAALGTGGPENTPSLSAGSASSSTSGAAAPDGAESSESGEGATEESVEESSDAAEETAEESSDATEGQAEDTSNAGPVQLADFSVATLDGAPVQLSSVYGKPAIVGFWATWCPPCNAEAPTIQKLYETYGDQVNFMMIDSASDGRDNIDVVKSWLAEGKYTYPVYIDETGEAAMAAQIYYLPTMFVLDKEGNVLTAFSGALDEASGMQLLEQLISL